MVRAISILAACLLVITQPLLASCQCVGCGSKDQQQAVAVTGKKSCCSTTKSSSTCCGSATRCTCGTDHQASNGGQADQSAGPCKCSTAPQPSAIAAASVQVDHSTLDHALPAHDAAAALPALKLQAGLHAVAHAPPPLQGGLRVHALYGVWLI